jgi:hypothetical protein
MTLFDAQTADYVARVAVAFQAGELSPNAMCAECGITFVHRLPAAEGGDHILIESIGSDGTGTGELLMVIGCEGYWHINPQAVGLPRGHWMSMDDQVAIAYDEDHNGHTDLNII